MNTETTELTDQQKMSQGLRELADFLDERTEFIGRTSFTLYKGVYDREEFLRLAKQLGTFMKDVDDSHYTLIRMFGPIKLEVYCDRKLICTKRLELKEVEVWDCPDHLLSGNDEKEPVHADGD